MKLDAASAMRSLRELADPEKAAFFPRFFKTGKGQYGEGDVFIGVTVPQIRTTVKVFQELPLSEVEKLLDHKIHEFRLLGLLILVRQYEYGDTTVQKKIVRFYLDHLHAVNNWDLVDSSARQILGASLFASKETTILDRFAHSKDLWKQRIAIIATHYFIMQGAYDETLRIAEILLHHPHDLIHKAVGWMLREVGNRDRKIEEKFLKKHAAVMPRTMLRYAIEKFDPATKKRYMTMKN